MARDDKDPTNQLKAVDEAAYERQRKGQSEMMGQYETAPAPTTHQMILHVASSFSHHASQLDKEFNDLHQRAQGLRELADALPHVLSRNADAALRRLLSRA